jgi:antitoxin component YwqK of YwqJK toxin-antitoxin module
MDSLGLNEPTTELLLKPLKATGAKYITKPKLIDFSEYRTGDYTYYYKNGVIASKGRVERQQKVGTWKYWDVNGGLYKVIDYENKGAYINPSNGDTIKYWGFITMWHPNGDTLLTGLIRSEKDRFNCNQEMKVDIQNVFYLSYFDQNNKTDFKNGTGPVTEYHTNGEIRVTGSLKNGKKDGMWKYYTPQGRLEEIGKYSNGEKTGLWIKGDLEAVPYIEDLCIQGQMDSYKFPDVDGVGYLTQEIKLVQTMYTNGKKRYSRTTRLLPLY